MIVFINGSVNSGKTTTARLLAEKLNAKFIDFDDIRHTFSEIALIEAIPRVMSEGAAMINDYNLEGFDVVANYVIDKNNYMYLISNIDSDNIHFVTLSPSLGFALTNRGRRVLDKEEIERIKYHYKIGIPDPDFGTIIDNSILSIDQTANMIIDLLAIKK